MEEPEERVLLRKSPPAGRCTCGRLVAVFAITAVVVVVAVGLIIGVNMVSEQEQSLGPRGHSATGQYRYAAVAADAGLCSTIGTNLMARQGASAVDAAIAVDLCQGVMDPQSAGIGGGHFMVIYDTPRGGNKRVFRTISARECAPAKAHKDMFENRSFSGPLTIAVPGDVLGLQEAWKEFHRLEWRDVIMPAWRLARDGFPVSHDLASKIKSAEAKIRKNPGLRKIFILKDGSVAKEGDILTRPELANTLRQIMDGGAETYYNGSLAKDIAADIAEAKGIVTAEDLKTFHVEKGVPVTSSLRTKSRVSSTEQVHVHSMPLPSSAVVMEFMLRLIEGYNLRPGEMGWTDSSTLTWHRIIETMKFGFAERTNLGDPHFVNVSKFWKRLRSETYINDIRKKITDDRTHNTKYYGGIYALPADHGTTHFSVLAPDGAAVAVTSTVNELFGSQVVGRRTGIIFNDEMTDFSIPHKGSAWHQKPSPANFIAPGKRPLSSMSPTIVTDDQGHVIGSYGGSGGTTILTGVFQTAALHLLFNRTVEEAIDFPRMHHQLLPDYIMAEEGFSQELMDNMKKKGHHFVISRNGHGFHGVIQGLQSRCAKLNCDEQCKTRCVMATSDYRKSGSPDGY